MKAWRYGLVVLALFGFFLGWVSFVEAQTGECQEPGCEIKIEEPSPCTSDCPEPTPGGGGRSENRRPILRSRRMRGAIPPVR